MKIKPRYRHFLMTLAVLALIVVLAGVGMLFPLQKDITANTRNSLSPATTRLLDTLPEPVRITAYIKKGLALRLQIGQLLDRYRQHKANLDYQFIDPDSQPELTRELDIGDQGAVIVEYQGRSEKIAFLDESTLTNALLHLGNNQQRWVSFLTGHGERSAQGVANFDLGRFSKELARRNITAVDLNLATVLVIPENSSLLVITAPSVAFLPGEIELIKQYLQQGGNLLLTTDPGNSRLSNLLDYLGIRQLDGAISDNGGKLYGLNDPSFVIATAYPDHAITRGLQLITVYPGAAALTAGKTGDFKAQVVLESSDITWLEEGPMQDAIAFDKLERKGPFPFGHALTRTVNKIEQRIIVLGDSDFLSNTYLDNVGNLDMGVRLINWLIHDDRFIDIPAKVPTDKNLQLSSVAVSLMGFGFLLGLPALLLASGTWVWFSRWRR